ncbi:MAG: cytochrome ubiquinol oxidase subunit I [Anaerolineales bacterium]|nr:cytochrome ubiquinol oxidase subunit I [Anaerolineales bacterium]
MDALILARLQFAITTIYHFFFVPLTLGLSIFIAIMETQYVRTGQEVYKRMTKFWGKLFLINFAIGVVTGIVQEFQFGMNWSEYSRYVGDIFGAPLAIEALTAFFLESTFLGIWIFGWEKLSKGLHATVMWLVAIGSNLSALWILIANSFMQQPVGYVINNGRAELTDFFAVITNPNIGYQFAHVFSSGLATAALFVLGISAYHLVQKNEIDFFKRSFKLAAIIGVIASIAIGINGHSQTQHVVENQPMKMAAAEGLWESEDPASFSLITIGSLDGREEIYSLRIPGVLSFLAYNRFEGKIFGMNELQQLYEQEYGPGSYMPPAVIPYWTFRAMVGAGMLMVAITGFALYISLRNKHETYTRILRFLPLAIALPYLANASGWLLTEVGRFPWIVFGLVKLEAGVSPTVSASMLWISLIGYILVYSLLIVATIYLMRKFAKAGPIATDDKILAEEPTPSLVATQD